VSGRNAESNVQGDSALGTWSIASIAMQPPDKLRCRERRTARSIVGSASRRAMTDCFRTEHGYSECPAASASNRAASG